MPAPRRIPPQGEQGNSVNVSITSGNATHIYANSGNYTGDVWLTISKEGQASAWYGAHGASGTLNGNVFLRFTDAATGGSTVFGAVNAAGVTGNVYLGILCGKRLLRHLHQQ